MSHDDMESWEATVEIMSDPEMMAAIRQSERDFKEGRFKTYSEADLDKLLGPSKPRKRASGRRAR